MRRWFLFPFRLVNVSAVMRRYLSWTLLTNALFSWFVLPGVASAQVPATHAPYPHSQVISAIHWDWSTRVVAANGSDLWPVTWGPDDNLYAAWGDGGGFGGSDTDGRVALGFARIEGTPAHWRGISLNGGKDCLNPATFAKKGKTTGIVFVKGTLYATINLENGKWPDVDHALAWSTNYGATWTLADWRFSKGEGNLQPAKFISFGKDYAGAPRRYRGYVYLCGPKQSEGSGSGNQLFLAREPERSLQTQHGYELFAGLDEKGKPRWEHEQTLARSIFSDPNGVTPGAIVYVPALRRFLLTCFHVGPSQLGVFEATELWGPWRTVAYYEHWGAMGKEGEGLTCGFIPKWTSPDGLTTWAIFSVYGEGAKRGIDAHDKFNLIKATLEISNRKR